MPLSYLDQVEFDTSNPEPRCPCVLLLDVSASMTGAPIQQLNQGLTEFQLALREDELAAMRVEVAMLTFGGRVQLAHDFVPALDFQANRLQPKGNTPMGEAIHQAFTLLDERKLLYKHSGVPYYRPWIFMLTDGAPTDTWQIAAERVREEEARQGVAFFAVGVQSADMNILRQIAVRQPVKLKGLRFREMFLWLSQSLTLVSHSQPDEQVMLEPPVGWADI